MPYLPPLTAASLIKTPFRHFGDEVILESGEDYVYLENHDASRFKATSFWDKMNSRELKSHYMKNYLLNILNKIDQTKEIPWSKKSAYLDKTPLLYRSKSYTTPPKNMPN